MFPALLFHVVTKTEYLDFLETKFAMDCLSNVTVLGVKEFGQSSTVHLFMNLAVL